MDSTWGDANNAMPKGYHPHRVTEPPRVDLDVKTATDDEPMIVARGDLRVTAEALGSMRVLAALLEDGPHPTIARQLGDMARFWQQHVRLVAGIGAALLVAVGLAVAPVGGQAAQAAEAPQPDPVAAQTVRVTLGAAPVTVYVQASVYTETAPGWWCGSVWTARGRIAGTCSIGASFPIPVTVDPRTFPVGRTFAQVIDDATDVAVSNVTIDARRPSRFGVGYFEDRGQGDLYVRVPVTLYNPTLGRWVPQVASPVRVQERIGGVWRTRATLTTNPPGLAVGIVHLGGGIHVVRVVRPAGRTVWSTTGRVHTFDLLTEPVDVD